MIWINVAENLIFMLKIDPTLAVPQFYGTNRGENC